MTLHHETRAWSMERLGPPDLLEVFGFLDRDPVVNVYLLALTLRDGLAHPRDEFWGVRRDGDLVGLLHLGGASGATLPIGDDPETLERIAEQAVVRLGFLPSRFQVIGPREAVETVVARLGDAGLAPRLARQQVYMSVDRGEIPSFERLSELRRATRDDLDLVHESGAMLRAEELDEDPRAADAAGYAKRVEEECRDGYTHLWVDADGLCFRASVSALTPDAAQVSGVYTPLSRRNRGLARRALSELSERLFERSRSVCLFVNDFNAPAIALYRRIGFRDRAPWASAFYDRRR